MKSRRFVYSSVFIVSVFILAAPRLFAQTGDTSALTGRITDTTGAVLPGVSVTVTSIATNQSRTVISAEDGVYRIQLLDPGGYRVRFAAPGFKTKEVMSVTLAVTDTVALDEALEVGATTEEITVEAVAETIQTATSTVGTTVSGNTIASLPLPARNFIPAFVRLIEAKHFDAKSLVGATFPLDRAREALQAAADRTVISTVVVFDS